MRPSRAPPSRFSADQEKSGIRHWESDGHVTIRAAWFKVNTWLPPNNLKLDFNAQVSPARTLALFCVGTAACQTHNLP